MIDIHCHLLAGVDDGPRDMQQSLEMARVAAADGIRTIVATPHIGSEVVPTQGIRSAADIRQQVSSLNQVLAAKHIDIEVISGAEVSTRVSPAELQPYTINHSRYLLVEFPHTHLPAEAARLVFDMAVKGLRPIIAHPERNPTVTRQPKKLLELVAAGALLQITAGSLTGDFGFQSEACAMYLLKAGVVSFLSSDAHSPDLRPPLLAKALKRARRLIGRKPAAALIQDNPQAVLEDRPINQPRISI